MTPVEHFTIQCSGYYVVAEYIFCLGKMLSKSFRSRCLYMHRQQAEVMQAGKEDAGLVPLWGSRSTHRLPFIVIADLIKSRNLLRLLVKRDLGARYRRTYLGYVWAVLEPLLLALVYSFIFTVLVGSTDPYYAVKIVVGVIGWTLFARSLTISSNSLISSINLFQFARVPKTVFATSGVLTNLTLSIVSLTSLIPFFIIHELSFSINLVFVVIWMLVLALTGWGLGLFLAPLACRLPDTKNIVNFSVRVGFFLSPVMWTYEMFNNRFGDGWYAFAGHLNPTIVPITGMRDAVLGQQTHIQPYAQVLCFGFVAFAILLGTIVFERKAHSAVVNL